MFVCNSATVVSFSKKNIFWETSFKGKNFDVIIKTPLLFVSGDNEGLDKIAGRYGSHSKKVKSLCRYCNTPCLETGNPLFPFKYLTNQQMLKLTQEQKMNKLQKLSHHCLDNNIFQQLQFCHNKRGFRAGLPFDILHTIQLGWMEYIIEGLFNTQCLTAQGKREEKEELSQSGIRKQYFNKEKANLKDKSKRNVFSNFKRKKVD